MIQLPWTKEYTDKVMLKAGVRLDSAHQYHYESMLRIMNSWNQYWEHYNNKLDSINPRIPNAYKQVYYEYKVQKLLELDVAKVSNKEVQ